MHVIAVTPICTRIAFYDAATRKRTMCGYVRDGRIHYVSSAGGCWHYVATETRLVEALADLVAEGEPE